MEQKWFFPKVVLEIMQEFISLMVISMLEDRSNHDEVDDVAKPRSVGRNGKEMLIKE